MKLIKTIEKIIQESEEQYNNTHYRHVTFDELDRIEKQYNDSLKLLNMFKTPKDKSHTKKKN